MKAVLHLQYVYRRSAVHIGLYFPYERSLIQLARLLGAEWSADLQCWSILDLPENRAALKRLFAANVQIDASMLTEGRKSQLLEEHRPKPRLIDQIRPDVQQELLKFKQWMQERRYSAATIETYSVALITFLSFVKDKSLLEIDTDDLLRFNNEYILARNLSESYQSQAVNAVKLFFGRMQKRQLVLEDITRPKKSKRLPNVLSKEEVRAILESPRNLKHRAMLSLIYACGLRCGDLLRLVPANVDAKRHILILQKGKGNKDRIAPLSEKVLQLLREYFKAYRPKKYLFEGDKEGEPYSERSLQRVLKNAAEKAKVRKPVTLHWLRHSYATHLLENGTDLRYIQEILGHKSSRTTEIYTHVSTRSLQAIRSPFDDL